MIMIPARPLVIMGDFNVARTDEDVFDIAAFTGSTHVTPAERAGLESLVDWGLVDVAARPGKNDRPFTYWDYRAGMFPKDLGMRIDYVLASPILTVIDAYVDREARKGKMPSDHAPVIVDLERVPAMGASPTAHSTKMSDSRTTMQSDASATVRRTTGSRRWRCRVRARARHWSRSRRSGSAPAT